MASSKRKGLSPSFRESFTSLPGYLAVQNLLRLEASVPAAFSRLEVMHPEEARNFLKAPAEVVAKRVKEEKMDQEEFIEVAMFFGMVMVMADRERRDIECEEAKRRIRERVTQEEKEVKQADGDNSVPL